MTTNQLRTSADALRFAIEFAQRDLSSAQPQQLSDQINQFFVLVPDLVRGKPYPLSELVSLQRDVQRLVNGVVRSGVSVIDVQLKIFVTRPNIGRQMVDSRVLNGVNGSLRDRFLYRVTRLLEELGAHKLLVCKTPSCGRVFYKVGKKDYCTTICQNRENQRNYRQQNLGGVRRSQHGKTRAR